MTDTKIELVTKLLKEYDLYIKKVRNDKIKVGFFRIFILISFIALWEISATLKWVDPFLTSSPSRMLK